MLNRRLFLKRAAGFIGAGLAFLGVRKAKGLDGWRFVVKHDGEPQFNPPKPIPAPMILDIQNDHAMAMDIIKTHCVVDSITGKTIVNPDGGVGIYFGDELRGMCRAYKVRSPYVAGKSQAAYYVFKGTDTRVPEDQLWVKFGYDGKRSGKRLAPNVEKAWHEFNAPIRFVPIKGKEAEAAEVRARYDARAFEKAREKQRWEEAGSPTLYGIPIYFVDRISL